MTEATLPIPPGWRLVPEEPDKNMLQAAMKRSIESLFESNEHCNTDEERSAHAIHPLYRAMLDAAPEPPVYTVTVSAPAVDEELVAILAPIIREALDDGEDNATYLARAVISAITPAIEARAYERAAKVAEKMDFDALRCVGGHDRCFRGIPDDDCPYCEVNSEIARAIRALATKGGEE